MLSYTIRLSVTVKMLSYTIRLSVTIKEYKEVPLSLRPYSLLEAASDPKCMMSGEVSNCGDCWNRLHFDARRQLRKRPS